MERGDYFFKPGQKSLHTQEYEGDLKSKRLHLDALARV
jgi:hypothetical protein